MQGFLPIATETSKPSPHASSRPGSDGLGAPANAVCDNASSCACAYGAKRLLPKRAKNVFSIAGLFLSRTAHSCAALTSASVMFRSTIGAIK